MIFAILVFGLSMLGAAIGVQQVRRGVRGVAIDDHPCCGRCGYDLIHAAASAHCPECGGPADAPRRIGNRVRQPRRIGIGAGLVLVSGLVLTAAIHRAATRGSMRSVEPLWTLRVEARNGSLSAIDEIGRRVRAGVLSAMDLAVVIDEALALRHSDWVGMRVAWGDVVDAGLATGVLDEARTRRCFAEAVGVVWDGGFDSVRERSGRSDGGGLFFVFGPAVGSRSTVTFDADIESVLLDGVQLSAGPRKSGMRYAHVRNSAPGDTDIGVELPGRAAGKSLVVRWRVKIKDAVTGAPLADDWVHEEAIAIPLKGDDLFFGSCRRETETDAAADQ